jgi:D-alanine-D-alanine ligase
MLLDALRLPYTGSPGAALFQSSGKLVSKRLMRAAGLPTADWAEAEPGGTFCGEEGFVPGRYIVKSVWEHASFGMDASCIVEAATAAELQGPIAALRGRLGGEAFAERFIDGREFNLSVLDGPEGPQVLPPAEIRFVDFADDRPKVVDWRAKWEEGSFEYANTPRTFDFPERDEPLLDDLRRLALECWRAFGMAGWARVDFRVDPEGRPWILEINANPCINPDAGFAAALDRAGIGYDEAVARIVAAALRACPAA